MAITYKIEKVEKKVINTRIPLKEKLILRIIVDILSFVQSLHKICQHKLDLYWPLGRIAWETHTFSSGFNKP